MRLGSDEWGDWMAVPAGSRRWKGEERLSPTSGPAVFCAPPDGWWHLHYNGAVGHPTYTHFVDIVTPPRWVGESRYEMVDLDLDVAVRHDGSVEIQDEDEFEVHQIQYGYTQVMIETARRVTDEVAASIRNRQEPFFEVAEGWLAQVES